MTKRIHRNDLLLVGPLREWSNVGGWLGIGEVGSEKVSLKFRGHDKMRLSWSLQEMVVEEDSVKKGGQTCGLS